MEYALSFLELRGKSLNMHPLLPESGSYFARQSGALGNPKLKLFHLRHDLNYTYETSQLKEMSVRFLDYYISGRANCNPHRFHPSLAMVRTTDPLLILTVPLNFKSLTTAATPTS